MSTATVTVQFDSPANPIPGVAEMKEIAEILRSNIGEWGLIGKSSSANAASTRAYDIRHGVQPGFSPAGSFEAESRTIFGEFRVYAKCVQA